MTLTELGPTFIKVGQLLSTRPDLIGLDLAFELEKLQSDAPKDPFETTKQTIENEQGLPLEDIFIEFEEEPIASASIGHVHRAKLDPRRFAFASSGDEENVGSNEPLDVVVKVRHAGIDRIVETDLDILSGLAPLAQGPHGACVALLGHTARGEALKNAPAACLFLPHQRMPDQVPMLMCKSGTN